MSEEVLVDSESIFTYSVDNEDTAITIENLDSVFIEQTKNLRCLMQRSNNQNSLEICQKWMIAFHATPNRKSAKLARNCLSDLLQMQLQKQKCLTLPFTNLENCNYDLEQVLQKVDFSKQSKTILKKAPESEVQVIHKNPNFMESSSLEELAQKKKNAENIQLKKDVQILELRMIKESNRNLMLKAKLKQYVTANEDFLMEFADMGSMFLDSIKSLTEQIGSYKATHVLPINMFESLFKDFADDEFIKELKGLDKEFEKALSRHFKVKLEKRCKSVASDACELYKAEKIAAKQKYKKRLHLKTWAQKINFKIIQVECFTEVRQFLASIQDETKKDLSKALRELEDKYQAKVSQLF